MRYQRLSTGCNAVIVMKINGNMFPRKKNQSNKTSFPPQQWIVNTNTDEFVYIVLHRFVLRAAPIWFVDGFVICEGKHVRPLLALLLAAFSIDGRIVPWSGSRGNLWAARIGVQSFCTSAPGTCRCGLLNKSPSHFKLALCELHRQYFLFRRRTSTALLWYSTGWHIHFRVPFRESNGAPTGDSGEHVTS